jgi:pimeloyl-ACP methyl ester carboxylesterase
VALPLDQAGSGPALVLLHAGIADRTMWAAHLQPLAATGRRVIAVDLPGFGDAPEPADGTPPWRALLATLDELGVDDFALVGNSLGGAVALRVAVVAPGRVRSLVLVSARPPDHEPSAALEAGWAAEEEAAERGDVEAAVAAVVDFWTLPDAPEELREHVAAMQRRAYEHQLGVPEPETGPDPVEDDPAVLGTLRMPVLVTAGEHDRTDFHWSAARLAEAIPGAERAVIAGAGHLAPLETPEAFRALLLEFLERTP